MLNQVLFFHCSSVLPTLSEDTSCHSGNHLTRLRGGSQVFTSIIYLFIYSKQMFFSSRRPEKKIVRHADSEQDAVCVASLRRGSGRGELTGRKVLTAGRWRATLERWSEWLSGNQSGGEGEEEERRNRKCDAAETLQ